MKWWQIKKRDADLERELRSDLELEEESSGKMPFQEKRLATQPCAPFGNRRDEQQMCQCETGKLKISGFRRSPHVQGSISPCVCFVNGYEELDIEARFCVSAVEL
jgi:hypothetical protein